MFEILQIYNIFVVCFILKISTQTNSKTKGKQNKTKKKKKKTGFENESIVLFCFVFSKQYKTKQNKTKQTNEQKRRVFVLFKSIALRTRSLSNTRWIYRKNTQSERETCIKGVLHPRPILWQFVHFSQNVKHIGDK